MANGNPADVGYNPQGVPEAVLQGLINRKSPKAAGLEGFLNSGFFPQLGQTIQQMGQNEQKKKKQDQLQQLLQAMRTQGAPQQGPQMPAGPPIQGPAGYTPPGAGPSAVPAGQAPMPQNPTSGMGAPAQDNSDRIKQLMMAYDPQGSMEAMQKQMFPAAMNPLQQSQADYYKAKTGALQKGPQSMRGGGQGGWRAIQDRDGSAYLYNEGTGETRQIRGPMPPKPGNPVPAAALDVKTQIANNTQAPWWKKLLGQTPPIQNPLQQQASVPQQGQMLNGKKVVAVEQVQ